MERTAERAAERHVQDVARRVRLVLDDVVLLEGEGELDGVPVVEHPGAVRQAGGDRQERQCRREEEIAAVGLHASTRVRG